MNSQRLKRVIKEYKKNKQAIFASTFLLVIILLAIFAFLIPIDPNQLDISRMMQGPGAKHLFGTDEVGRDYFIRCLYGARVSLSVGILAMLTSVAIGVTVGTVSGFFGGWIDDVLMRFIDLISSIPWMILVTVISIFLKPGIRSIIVVIGLFTWMDIARLVRAEILSYKEREYVQYAKFIGENSIWIILKHILPSVLPTIITAATAGIANAILTESSLSFLGLGVQQPMSSWGSLLNSAQANLQKAPHMAFIPGVLIFLTIYSFNKIGDILRVFVQPSVQVED